MNKLTFIKTKGSIIALVLSMLLFMLSLLITSVTSDSTHVAEKTGKRLEKKMAVLDRNMADALKSDHKQWLELDKVPDDLVIYRYVNDSLQSWYNQFPVINDEIGSKMLFYRLSNLRGSLTSPLADINETPSYINLGTKWYIVKSITDNINCKIIGGIEVKNNIFVDLRKSGNGTNPYLRIPGKFSAEPLDYTGGATVYLGNIPMFKIIGETTTGGSPMADSLLRWLALLFFTISVVLHLWMHKSMKAYAACMAILLTMAAIAYLWGNQMRDASVFFSPTIYADGRLFNSFGSLMIVNIYVILYILCTYTIRNIILFTALRKGTKRAKIIYTSVISFILVCTVAYTHYSLRSLIMNSNITFELYVWNSISYFTVLAYISYIGLSIGILLLVHMLKPVVHGLTGMKYKTFSKKFLFGYAALCALYFTASTGILGLKKEQDRIIVWTNRLAIDRDLGLEIQLRSVEEDIANDPLISSLCSSSKNSVIIFNRLSENYFNRISQEYDVSISVCKDSEARKRGDKDTECLNYFNRKLKSGSPISPDSRFYYTYDTNGISSYTGMFIFYSPGKGIVRLFVEITSKPDMEGSGYRSILDSYMKPGEVHIPTYYSYAKFISDKLVSYKGTFAYPTIINNDLKEDIDGNGHKTYKNKGYLHFTNQISNEEVIIVSRPIRGSMTYFITFSYLILVIYGILLVISVGNTKKNKAFRKNYFRSTINTVLFSALFFTLVSMVVVSVTFVNNRNEQNLQNMMSDRINTIQALLQSKCRYINNYQELGTHEFTIYMESVSNTTKSDVTIYTPGGKVFKSTAPEIFDRMIIGTRINKEAFYNIKYRYQRFYIQKEQLAGHKYYALYAPLFNAKGNLIGIVSSPYTDGSFDFTQDAVFHAATIINLFFILLMATILASTTVVNAMFKPLIEMVKKMNTADIHGLEYIIYKREDEISGIVDAYNRMVHDLSDSTKQLAQAERDKAWSEMARQVAHEIKNPLTPIKLEIQRLIRLKQRNDSSWSEKFDKVSGVILEHIDILTDTANEFSTFAKLYSEDPVLIDLDKTLRDQLFIFDNKDNIKISYIGMEKAMAMAPKPQLIRVFVNLITNAIQAIEIQQKDNAEDGKEFKQGNILICLRNSIKDGYYDIVFEDDGPGVNDENRNKLFTPNFTTKSAGTGLGLAICRNIIEKCNGEILYQRSFSLNGACFTVRLPKY